MELVYPLVVVVVVENFILILIRINNNSSSSNITNHRRRSRRLFNNYCRRLDVLMPLRAAHVYCQWRCQSICQYQQQQQ
jgi:hypothetical protein